MNEKTNRIENIQSGLYPIRTVSNLTGVNAITLRAWERRYALFEPVRKSSGHRLYTQEHIDRITHIVGLLDRGMRIGEVKKHLQTKNPETGAGQNKKDVWELYLDRMISAVIQFNESGLEQAYGEALSMFPADMVTEKLLMPLMKELGRRWAENEGSIAEEHFFGFYIRNKLGARFHHRNKTATGPAMLLACLPGDRHEIGLLLFALAASNDGYKTIMLGTDMPLEELPATVRKTGSKVLILSGLVKPSRRLMTRDLPKLAERVKVPVFLGGNASILVHDMLVRANIHVLGTDLNTGLQRIREIVPVS